MKKHWFLGFLVSGILFICISNVAHALPFATLELQDPYISVGETFDVEVWGHADGVTSATDYDLWLTFAFEPIVTGSAFSWNGVIPGTVAAPFDDVSGSFLAGYVAGMVFPGIGDENVLLATLQFTALAESPGSLSVWGDSSTFDGMGFWLNGFFDINASIDIEVNAPAPIPEPSTMLLFSIGVLGLAGFNRKKP